MAKENTVFRNWISKSKKYTLSKNSSWSFTILRRPFTFYVKGNPWNKESELFWLLLIIVVAEKRFWHLFVEWKIYQKHSNCWTMSAWPAPTHCAGGTVGNMARSTTSRSHRIGLWSGFGAGGWTRCPCPRWSISQHSIQIKSLRMGHILKWYLVQNSFILNKGSFCWMKSIEWKKSSSPMLPLLRNYNARNGWAKRRVRSLRYNAISIAPSIISSGLCWPHGVKTPGSSPSLVLQQLSL